MREIDVYIFLGTVAALAVVALCGIIWLFS